MCQDQGDGGGLKEREAEDPLYIAQDKRYPGKESELLQVLEGHISEDLTCSTHSSVHSSASITSGG